MDRLIYTAMSGSAQALEQQAVVANNLANASTTGFRAQLETFRAVPMSFGDGSSINDNTTRTFVLSSTPGADYTPGPIQQTGNPLDVAIQGPGWLSLQTADGNEAYTRAGNLHIDENGQLVNATNQVVLGNGGPVSVPPGAQITIGKDGTVSALTPGDPPTAVVTSTISATSAAARQRSSALVSSASAAWETSSMPAICGSSRPWSGTA